MRNAEDALDKPRASRLTLTRKIGILLLLPLVGALVDVGFFAFFLSNTRHDIVFVDVAGRQRMLSVELRAWAHMVAIGQEEDREGLRARIIDFDQTLTALLHGGELRGARIDPQQLEIAAELDALATVWGRIKPDVDTVASTATSDARFDPAYRRVEANLGDLKDAAHAIITKFEARRSRLRARMFAVLGITALETAVIFLFGLWLTRRVIVRPILGVNEAASLIAAGDFSRRLDVGTDDELATLARTFNDMTKKVQDMLAALELRRKHAERIVSSVPAGVLVADSDLRVVSVNTSVLDHYGGKEASFFGRPVVEVLGAPELEPHLRHVLATDEARLGLLFAGRHPRTDAPRHMKIAVTGTRLTEDDARLLVVVEDLTEEERREAQLKSLERRFKEVVETAGDGIILMEQDGTISGFNAAAERTFGWRRDEVIDKPVTILMPEKYRAPHSRGLARLLADPDSSSFIGKVRSVEALRKDGAVIPIDLTVTSYSSGGTFAFTGVVRDITERKRAEEALKRSEESFRLLIEVAPDAVLVHRDGRIVYANPTAASLLGFEAPADLKDRDLAELVHADEREDWRADAKRAAAGAPTPPHEHRIRRRDGAVLIWEVATLGVVFDGEPATLVVGRDVTERRQMAARMMRMDRMASVGTLAAGVGHEINNPLSYVIANVDVVAQGMPELASTLEGLLAGPSTGPLSSADLDTMLGTAARISEMKEAIDEAREGAERVRRIVRDLKTFSRAEEEEKRQPVSLRCVAESVLNIAWNEIRHRARLVKNYTSTPPVLANDTRLGQVILNLLVNAAQAIPEGHVETNEIQLRTWAERERVFLEVRDTGSGIAPEALSHIFDPFFTTKPVGQGTGLGLSIAHTIVSSLGGEITVESELGKGTAFRVALPPARLEAVEPEAARTVGQGQRGRVLVVDDEQMVGRALGRVLAVDHDVVTVTSARAALARLQSDAFDIVISDLMMPDMTGMELHEQLSAQFPEQAARMVFLTGGAFTPRAREFLDRVPNQRLEKPVDGRTLRALLRDLLR